MGRKSGHNFLGLQLYSRRGHYTTQRRKDAIRKENAARWKKHQTQQTSTTSVPPFNSSIIMNLDELSNQFEQITAHSAVCGSLCVLKGETFRAGLACIIEGKCLKCNTTFTIPSSSRITSSTGKKFWTVNVGAVLGQMATGGGASRLQQVMGSVGVASVSKQTFTSTERKLNDSCPRLCLRPAKRSREMLKVVHEDYFEGVPAITVIADGGWSKRSHKHSYNAKSGVAVIFGIHTKKLLFLGVRNKY